MSDHDADVAAVLAEALREEAWQGRWRPLDETNIVPLVNVTVPVVLAALTAAGIWWITFLWLLWEWEGAHEPEHVRTMRGWYRP